MLNNISIGQYIPGDSVIHKLDPRTKILSSVLYIITLFLANSFLSYGVICAFIFFVIYASKLKFSYIYKGLKPIFILVIITALFNLFLVKGDVLIVSVGFLKVYKEGVIIALKMIIRIVFIVIGTSVLTLTTSPIELTDGIEILLKPYRKIGVPAHELAMMLTIALRFIPTLMDETDKIIKAQKARGADFESGNVFRRAKALVPILVPLFINSFRRAEELAMAMEARCYKGGDGRTRMKVLKYKSFDYTGFVIVFLIIAVVILLKVYNF